MSSPRTSLHNQVSAAEWKARTDLAAAHRMAANYGWTYLIYNHISLRVPDDSECFLVKPNDLMFEEVTASSLMKLRIDGKKMGEDENVNMAGFLIHTAVLDARPDINSAVHIHTPRGMAFSAHGEGLKFISQGSMRFYGRLSYHDYEGFTEDEDERKRICGDLGNNNTMIMRNHGLLTCGRTIGNAMVLMDFLMQCIESQMMLEASHAPMHLPSKELCEQAARQWAEFETSGATDAEWPAMLRMLDRKDSSYKH